MIKFYDTLSERERFYTLIELIVVVSVIALLVSLLLSTMKLAIEKEKQLACAGNQRDIGIATNMYIGDNNGWFPGTHMKEDAITFDDRLAIYFDVNLTEQEMYTDGLQSGSSKDYDHFSASFTCPKDEYPVGWGLGAYRRSYSINGANDGLGISGRRRVRGKGVSFTSKITDLEDTEGTIWLSERFDGWNKLGRNTASGLVNPHTQLRNYTNTNVHGKFTFNYLFADGHVVPLEAYSTWPSMWTIKAND